jgi:hypothetical protein
MTPPTSSDLELTRWALARADVRYVERNVTSTSRTLDVEAQAEGLTGYVAVLSAPADGGRWVRRAVRPKTLRFQADGTLSSASVWAAPSDDPPLPVALSFKQVQAVLDAIGVSLATWDGTLKGAVDALKWALASVKAPEM